jgi:hypothetical protein
MHNFHIDLANAEGRESLCMVHIQIHCPCIGGHLVRKFCPPPPHLETGLHKPAFTQASIREFTGYKLFITRHLHTPSLEIIYCTPAVSGFLNTIDLVCGYQSLSRDKEIG